MNSSQLLGFICVSYIVLHFCLRENTLFLYVKQEYILTYKLFLLKCVRIIIMLHATT